MRLIVPEKAITDQTATKIWNIIITVSVLLGAVFVIGVILLLPPDPAIEKRSTAIHNKRSRSRESERERGLFDANLPKSVGTCHKYCKKNSEMIG